MEISPELVNLVKVSTPIGAVAIICTLAIIGALRGWIKQADATREEASKREIRRAGAFDAQNTHLLNLIEKTTGALDQNSNQLARLDETLKTLPCNAAHADRNGVRT